MIAKKNRRGREIGPLSKRKPKEFQRRFAGLTVFAGPRCPPGAFVLYEVFWDDGTRTYERGHSLRTMHGMQDLNGTKAEKKRAGLSLRVDMHREVSAAAILFEHIAAECQYIDEQIEKACK